jgi:hypothetical protein
MAQPEEGEEMGDPFLLAYCGLYCGDCAGYSGEIADSATHLAELLSRYRFDRTARCLFSEELADYDTFVETLRSVATLRCPKVCRGRTDAETDCEIRACCIDREFYACHECSDVEGCIKLEGHEELHRHARVRSLGAIGEMELETWLARGRRFWFGSGEEDV